LIQKPDLSYHLNHFLWSGVDLIFPPSCGGCGKLGVRWCSDCQQNLQPVPLPICEICGTPQTMCGICQECQITRPAFAALRSCVIFLEPARSALIAMKYRQELGLGEIFAWIIGNYLDKLGWKADAIIPIPLSDQRLAERGYNQVDLIAYPLAHLIGWKYSPKALRRIRHTASQVGLTGWDRRRNVFGAFQAETKAVKGKTILLVDDVTTTGATINSASGSLLDAGAKNVFALTFAKALQRFGSDHEKSFSTRSLC
jgi:competence protein ComFC